MLRLRWPLVFVCSAAVAFLGWRYFAPRATRVSSDDASSQLRALAESTERAESLLDAIAGARGDGDALGPSLTVIEADAARTVAEMIETYRAMPAGREREKFAMRVTARHRRHFLWEHPGDSGFASVFMEIAATSASAIERREAVLALHGLSAEAVVDWFIKSAQNPDPDVRFYCVEGLAWVREGGAVPRARAALRQALSHDDARIRRVAAGCMASVVKDPADIASLREASLRETDPAARGAMQTAIGRLERLAEQRR